MPTADAEWKAATVRWWDALAQAWAGRPEAPLQFAPFLGEPAGGRILDAGCGAGAASFQIVEQGYRVDGVDLTPAMVTIARRRARERGLDETVARFAVGDVEALPAADGVYDGIVCLAVLDFVPRPGVALREFLRVLRPGGRLLLLMLGANSPVKRDPGRERWRRFLPEAPPTIPLNDILPWEMEALLAALGWRVVAQRPLVAPTLRGPADPYTAELVEGLPDRVMQQAVATGWQFVAEKP